MPRWIGTHCIRHIRGIIILWIKLQINISHNGGFVIINSPTRPKDIDRFGEEIVVDEACVHGEETHEEYNVTAGKEDVPDFVGAFHGAEFLLEDAECGGEGGHNAGVSSIAEHDAEQEGERDDGI